MFNPVIEKVEDTKEAVRRKIDDGQTIKMVRKYKSV